MEVTKWLKPLGKRKQCWRTTVVWKFGRRLPAQSGYTFWFFEWCYLLKLLVSNQRVK